MMPNTRHSETGKNLTPVDPARSWISGYYASFNGLRAAAVLCVFVNHYGNMLKEGVWVNTFFVGVDLFFVLSGFLITGILYDAKRSPHFFRNFYVRRALRIFPLYYGFFLLLWALSPVLHLEYQHRFWTNLLYVSNLFGRDIPGSNPTFIAIAGHPEFLGLGHLWSLCVEEQFYLIWPLVIWMLPTRRAMMWFAATAALTTFVLRTGLYLHSPAEVVRTASIYILTYTRCDGLFIGAWVALWLRGKTLTRRELRTCAYGAVLPSILVVVIGAATIGQRWPYNSINPLLCTYGYTLIGIACAGLLLLTLDERGLLARVLRNRYLSSLGAVSYGFYFFHEIVAPSLYSWYGHLPKVWFSGPAAFVGSLFLIQALSWLSFRYYESWFLQWKDRLAHPVRHRSVPAPAQT